MSDIFAALEQEEAPPLLKIQLPLPHRLNCFLRLWALKALAAVFFGWDRLVHPLPLSLRPTLVKYYPECPGLQTRIFYPPGYQAGKALPLYLNIHGGGFAVGDPQNDDEFCAMWARRAGMLVVSLDYSKTPLYPFPVAVHDVAAHATAVLADESLPIDKNRVVVGGFSAGANLALSASQLPGLKGLVKTAVAYYPMVNWDHPPDEMLRRRPYKDGPSDSLESSSWWFDWGYVSPGQNRRDPLLSPCFAKKEDLPPWIYMIAAEFDMLRQESQKMIHKLAGLEKVVDQEQDFEHGHYKWTLARGCSHGFTHHYGRSEEQKRMRERKCEPIYEQVLKWVVKALEAEIS